MDLERLFKIRRAVRRSDDVSDAAARLMCEVVDLHQLRDGCTATDSTLGDYIGKSTRTVARRRQELVDAGYLREEQAANCRRLVPKWPEDPDETGETTPDRFDETPDKTDEEGVKFDERGPDKSDTHKEIDIPTRESAPAREDDSEDLPPSEQKRFEKLRDLVAGTYSREQLESHAEQERGDPDAWRTAIYQLAHPDFSPQSITKMEWRETITDPVAWAEAVLKGWKRGWQPHTTDAREDTYEDTLERRTEVTEDGKLKGAPELDVEYNARGYRTQ